MSRPVVSADDVRAARRRGEPSLSVSPDALITPLARDEAARWGIEIVQRSPQPEQHAPTCSDPEDDVERIVSRVRERVPSADPGQIREIARRVLEQIRE